MAEKLNIRSCNQQKSRIAVEATSQPI